MHPFHKPLALALPSMPCCRVYSATVQGIPNVTYTAVTFELEDIKTHDGMHSTIINKSRIYIPAGLGGIWTGAFTGSWATNGTNIRAQVIRLNGSTNLPSEMQTIPSSVGACQVPCILHPTVLNDNDYLEAMCLHSAGGTVNFGTNSAGSTDRATFSIWRLGPAP